MAYSHMHYCIVIRLVICMGIRKACESRNLLNDNLKLSFVPS